jgi:hypothetical protein
MTERLTDDEIDELFPLMIELAELLSPPIAERLRFGRAHGAIPREVSVTTPREIDLVKLAAALHRWGVRL